MAIDTDLRKDHSEISVSNNLFFKKIDNWVFPVLYENARINPQFNIHPYNFGSSDKDGRDTFTHSDQNGYGICNSTQSSVSQTGSTNRFPVVKVADFLAQNYDEEVLEKLKFVKIDVGARELRVFKDLGPLLAQYKPLVWIKWPIGRSNKEILKAANDGAYYAIDFHTFDKIGETSDWTADLLFVPNGASVESWLYEWDA